MKQYCVFDVSHAIQNDLLPSIRHHTNFKAGQECGNSMTTNYSLINIL